MPKEKKVANSNPLSSPAFKLSLFIVSLLLISIGFLIGTPRVVHLTETKVFTSANQEWDKPTYLISDVGIEQTEKQEQIFDSGIPVPHFTSSAIFAMDYKTGQVLFQKNSNAKLPPASTTKLMAALVAVDHFKSDDILIVTPESKVGGSTMGLNIGEQLTFRSLLYGMLLNSGNDAAYTIAANYPGGINAFVDKMNQKVAELGLKNTHFQNPAGFDNPTHYSSAYDLAVIGKVAVENFSIARVVATKETYIISYDQSKSHILKNLNELLKEPGVIGIKTGFTENAGESFVGLVERENRKVLTVVLNSQDRFGETKVLMDWVYKNFEWKVE